MDNKWLKSSFKHAEQAISWNQHYAVMEVTLTSFNLFIGIFVESLAIQTHRQTTVITGNVGGGVMGKCSRSVPHKQSLFLSFSLSIIQSLNVFFCLHNEIHHQAKRVPHPQPIKPTQYGLCLGICIRRERQKYVHIYIALRLEIYRRIS